MVSAISAISSNHCLLILYAKPRVEDGGRFKYEAYWDDHKDCKDVVRKGWGKEFQTRDAG